MKRAMHAHFVLAHPEPQSFNAHLVRSGVAALEAVGWTRLGFRSLRHGLRSLRARRVFPRRGAPTASTRNPSSATRAKRRRCRKSVTDELALLDRADLLVLQYPMWWHLPPAMLKGWFDRVLAYGEVYTSSKRFENGRFVGKRAMLSVTVGTSREPTRMTDAAATST